MPTRHTVTVETPGDCAVVVRRRFDAPVQLVWRAYTQPVLVRKWLLGPPGWTMPVCEIDLRAGGAYTYRWRNEEDGTEFGFIGEFLEILPGARIVSTERPVDLEHTSEAHNVVEFVPLGDLTELVMTMTYESAEIRQLVLETGMTDGMGMSFDNLDEVLVDLTR